MPSLFDQPERFIRDSVVYDEFAYRIDHEKSALRGYFEKNGFLWTLHIASHEQSYPTDDEMRFPPLHAPSLDLTFPSGVGPTAWRDFEFTSYSFSFTGVTVAVGDGKPNVAAVRKRIAKRFDLAELQNPISERPYLRFELIPDLGDS